MRVDPQHAVSIARGDQLRAEWSQLRRSWLIGLAKRPGFPEDQLPHLSADERAFVQRCRLERVA